MKIFLPILLYILVFNSAYGQKYFGSISQDAIAKYQEGWKQIMDQGEWTLAEKSFRAAVEVDPEFHLAWAQVGRISKDPDERADIFQSLEVVLENLEGWEKLLLRVYLKGLEIIDLKEKGQNIQPLMIQEFYQNSLNTFGEFLKESPKEPYIFSEYIETIHGVFGAETALDSIRGIDDPDLRNLPFILSYQSMLEAESGKAEEAWNTYELYKARMKKPYPPSVHFTAAKIHASLGKEKKAMAYLQKTLKMDPNHTLAQRLYFTLK